MGQKRPRGYKTDAHPWHVGMVRQVTLPIGAPWKHPALTNAIFVVHGMGLQKFTETAATLYVGLDDALEAIESWQEQNNVQSPLGKDADVPPPYIGEGYRANYDDLKASFPDEWVRLDETQQNFFSKIWKLRALSRIWTFAWLLKQQVRLVNPRIIFSVGLVPWLIYLPLQVVSVTAQIAYDNLDAETKAEVDRLIQVLANYQPKVSNFVPGATWMDQIKGYDLRAFNNWHFIDIPYDPDSMMNVPGPGRETVTWAIRQATATLKSKRAGDFQKALMLRFLIHFVGDIHQPLHCIDRFTQVHPRGDMGGNQFLIKGKKEKELRAFWDDTANLFPNVDPKKTQAWQSQIPQFAKGIEQEIPPSEVPEWKKVDSDTWAQESYQVAKEVAYANIVENTKPSNTYVQEAQKIVRKRLALGGYRLPALLKAVLSKPPDP